MNQDEDKSVNIWYQVEGRDSALIRGFTGEYVTELQEEIAGKSKLANPPDTLQLFVKRQESDEEISLSKLEKDSGRKPLGFNELVSKYDIWRDNPIIVRQPGQEVPLKKIRANREIEETLTKIINSVNHQLHTLKTEEVEEFQKGRLGHFYKKPLPSGMSSNELYLPMLGQVLPNMQPTGGKRTFSEIIQSDVHKTGNHCTVAMVARSGSGKTATVAQLAKKHFVIYVVCEAKSGVAIDFHDQNYRNLAQEIDNMCSSLPAPVLIDGDILKYRDAILSYDYQLKIFATKRVQLEFLARQLFLVLLFRKYPQITPETFFREQVVNGYNTIFELVNELKSYDSETIVIMLKHVEKHLQTFLTGRGLVIALDEAHVAETGCLHEKLISPRAIIANDDLLDRNGMIYQDLRRGFLTPLTATLSDMPAALVVLGTKFSLVEVNHVYSAIGKPINQFEKITSFPTCDESHVEELLSQIIDISDCEIQPEKKRRLSGRFRFTTNVVAQICKGTCSGTTKQEIIDDAINKVIEKAEDDIRISVRKMLRSNNAFLIKNLLSRMIIAYKLKGGKIAFTQLEAIDFVNLGVCALREDSNNYHWIIEEPLVIEVLEVELRASGFDLEFFTYLDQLNTMITNLGINSAAKGEAFELLVYRSLQRFNGKVLADLPFVKDIKDLPEWCKTMTLNVRKFGTAKELGYGDDNTSGDVKFFEKTPGEELLIPNNLTRPDGALLLEGKEYGLSLAIKLYSQPVDRGKHELNTGSSDLRNCFMTTEIKVNSSIKRQRRRFTKTAFHKLKGILRIHLELPVVSGGTPQSCVNNQDILVYIDSTNMDTFFDESIKEYSQDMNILKKILKHIWRQ